MYVHIILETRNHPHEYTYSTVKKVFDSRKKAMDFLNKNPNHKDGYEEVTYQYVCKKLN